jgi:hypothetical protein
LGPLGGREWGPPDLVETVVESFNTAMRRNQSRLIRRRPAWGVAFAPLAVACAAPSIAITLVVAIGTVAGGRVPAGGPLGLICAVVLAAVAAAEASRPAKRDRLRRRASAPLDAVASPESGRGHPAHRAR